MFRIHFVIGIALATSLSMAADKPRLHPVEAACVTYVMSGQVMNGKTTRCHRNYAHEAYEIMQMKIGVAGFSQEQNTHNITVGDTIYAIDLSTNTGTKTRNPIYDQIVNATQGKDPEDMMDEWMGAAGFNPTGSSKVVAGLSCNIYNSSMAGTACLTDDGLMLEQSMMGNTTTATNVSIGESGNDDDYLLYKNVPITDGPDLSNMPDLQELMKGL